MTTPELIQRVIAVVNGKEFDEDSEILPLLNEGLFFVARNFNLPSLISNTAVLFTGGSGTASLPTDFHHSPYHAENTTYTRRLNVHTSSHSLYRLFNNYDTQGAITDVAVDGVTLVARPVPSDNQTVFVAYYKQPTPLTNDDTSSPDCLPIHLHDSLLVNYAAKELYKRIEDGVDGAMVNTNKYTQLFTTEGLSFLREYTRLSPIFTPYIKRHAYFI